MKRDWLCERLRRYAPFDSAQSKALDDVLAFVTDTRECFSRTTESGHVVGSAWIIDSDRSHVLLTHHAKLDRWLQLGGHAEDDIHILATAWREAREESGLDSIQPLSEEIFDIDTHRIPARGTEQEHWHYDVRFAFTAQRDEVLRVTTESKKLRWVPLGHVGALNTDDSVRRMVAKTPLIP